jgi:predicted nucleic acid-binding protein
LLLRSWLALGFKVAKWQRYQKARTPEGLPDICDADDIIFLILATVAQAEALVSGDGDIQAVRAPFHIPILTVTEFADWLQTH